MIVTGEGGAARRRRALPLCGSLVFAMSGPCGYWSSGLGGGGRAGPNAAGAGRSRWRLFGNACNFGVWAARSVQLHHSVSPEARRRSS